VVAVTNEAGSLIQQTRYDAWGLPTAVISGSDRRGYTGHEHLHSVGLINMNGRLYDPELARFLSPDPYIQDPGNFQNYNTYSYVVNSPWVFTDPSGELKLRDVFKMAVTVAVAYYTGQWVGGSLAASGSSWAVSSVTVTNGAITGYTLTTAGAMTVGAAGGFAGGFVGSGGNVQAGLRGAFTGAAFGWAGGVGGEGDFSRYAAHAGVGCVSGELDGSGCGRGAMSAASGHWMTVESNGDFLKTVLASGTASVIGGGKFANGAMTGAFGYLFNYLQHGRDLTPEEGERISDNAAKWKDTPYATAGTQLAGAAAIQGVGADCSGSTCLIYDQIGNGYSYKSSGQFAGAAAQEGFPFRQLNANEPLQKGDVILFKGHMAIYSGQNNDGAAMMWTARGAGRPYTQMPVKFWGTPPIGYYRFQVPVGRN
jgi:RHS repeat-associated protein